MGTKIHDSDEEQTYDIGPFSFTENMLILLVGAVSLLCFVAASAIGIPPDQATTRLEKLAGMNVIWTFMVMCTSYPLSLLMKKAGNTFFPKALPLMGTCLFAGAVLAALV